MQLRHRHSHCGWDPVRQPLRGTHYYPASENRPAAFYLLHVEDLAPLKNTIATTLHISNLKALVRVVDIDLVEGYRWQGNQRSVSMDQVQANHHDFSHNHFSVSGGEVRVHYGNNYQSKPIDFYLSNLMLICRETAPQTSEISWEDIRRWIFGAGSIFSQSTFQRSVQRRREEILTGLWFLEGQSFAKWITEPKSFLWLHGKSLLRL